MSRKSRTVMFRSTDVLIVTIEARLCTPTKLYLKYRYSEYLAFSPGMEGIRALSGFAAAVTEEVAEQRGGVFRE